MPLPYAANVPSYSDAGFIPIHFATQVNVKYYFETLLPRITNTKFQTQLLNKGDKVVIPQRPDIAWRDGQVAKESDVDIPVSEPVEFQISRILDYDFVIPDVLEKQSGVDVGAEGVQDTTLSMDGQLQQRLFADLVDKADDANMGATAGKVGAGYNLGTAASPLGVNTENAILFVTAFRSVLAEQKAAKPGMWVILPEILRYKLINSDLRKAMEMGDDKSVLRTQIVGSLDGTMIYSSPQLATERVEVSGTEVTAYAVIAGNLDAITFCAQLNKAEKLRYHLFMGDRYRGTVVYDWKVVKPQGLCVAWVYAKAES